MIKRAGLLVLKLMGYLTACLLLLLLGMALSDRMVDRKMLQKNEAQAWWCPSHYVGNCGPK